MSLDRQSQYSQEFLEKIQRVFDYLFERKGFYVIKQGGDAARCLVVLESKDCRIRIIYEMGGIELDIGTLEARPEWGGDNPPDLEWYGIYPVLDFIEGRPRPTLEESLARHKKLWPMSEDELMAYYSDELKPVCDKVCQLFSKDAPPEMQAAFRSFISDYFKE